MQDELEAITQIDERDAVLRLVAELYRQRGFGATCYMFSSSRDPERLELINLGFPTHIIDLYHALDLTAHDPHPAFVAGKGRVFTFSELSELDGFERKARALLSDLAASGLPNGLAIPVYGLRATTSLFCAGMPTGRGVVRNADRVAIQAIAQQAQIRIDQIAAADDGATPALSSRETQILRWIAAGKSNTELAIILGISQATVATYVKRLFAKLGVNDRVAAAVTGLRLGVVR